MIVKDKKKTVRKMECIYVVVVIMALWCLLIPTSLTLIPLVPLATGIATISSRDHADVSAWFTHFDLVVNGTIMSVPLSTLPPALFADCTRGMQWMYPLLVLALIGSYTFCVQLAVMGWAVMAKPVRTLPAWFCIVVNLVILATLVFAYQVLRQWNLTCFLNWSNLSYLDSNTTNETSAFMFAVFVSMVSLYVTIFVTVVLCCLCCGRHEQPNVPSASVHSNLHTTSLTDVAQQSTTV